MGLSEKEIIEISEAYNMYLMLPKKSQEKIPQEFVKKLKKYAKPDLGYPIECAYDLSNEEISEEGAKLMAYMSMFLK